MIFCFVEVMETYTLNLSMMEPSLRTSRKNSWQGAELQGGILYGTDTP